MQIALARVAGLGTAISLGAMALATHAQVNTSAIEDAVGTGIDAGTNEWGSMVSNNLDKIFVIFGIVLGIGFLIFLFRRAGRR